jgi:hypothetical protein
MAQESSRPSEPAGSPPPEGPRPPASIWTVLLGIILFAILDMVVMLGVVSEVGKGMVGEENHAASTAHAGAVVLAVAAFIGGGLLAWRGDYKARGFGLGLIIGWILATILSLGYFTAVNPGLYR